MIIFDIEQGRSSQPAEGRCEFFESGRKMMEVCQHCQCRLIPNPRVKNQRYCGKADCRRAWKREWQRNKKKNDSEYEANQKSAQRAWRKRNPEYWREYWKRNPARAERNRLKQKERMRELRRRKATASGEMFAKMDSIVPGKSSPGAIPPGLYSLGHIVDGKFAKMDSIIVEIRSS